MPSPSPRCLPADEPGQNPRCDPEGHAEAQPGRRPGRGVRAGAGHLGGQRWAWAASGQVAAGLEDRKWTVLPCKGNRGWRCVGNHAVTSPVELSISGCPPDPCYLCSFCVFLLPILRELLIPGRSLPMAGGGGSWGSVGSLQMATHLLYPITRVLVVCGPEV